MVGQDAGSIGNGARMKTVLAHGCFDLLHLGHIRHLRDARKLGDQLVVSITADKFVNKGFGRPRFTEDERAEALMALSFVDRVLVNRFPDAVDLIHHLKPAIYVKGSDYCGSDDEALKREAAAISEVGGDMVFTTTKKWSSTALLESETRSQVPVPIYAPYQGIFDKIECDGPRVLDMVKMARAKDFRLFFIGNGGSAAIASHMAADWQKTAKVPAMCFNDAAQLTALANDNGYHSVFAVPIKMHGRNGDVLFAISSSGESNSILHAVSYAKELGLKVVTLSGFSPTNRLRALGHVNFYVPSDRYGVVEAAHLVILHSLLDAGVEALK